MSNLEQETMERTIAQMRANILADPEFIQQLAAMAGIPTAEQMQAERQAREDAEASQEERLTELQGQITALQNQINADGGINDNG